MNYNIKQKLILISIISIIVFALLITKSPSVNNETLASSIEELNYNTKDYNNSININEDNIVSNEQIINITQVGTYIFTGSYEQTSITINVDKDISDQPVYIVLDNCNITSNSQNLLEIISANEVIINVLDNTTNYLTQQYNTTEEEKTGAIIYSSEDLIINGTGNLILTTNYNDAINSRDDLVIENTNIKINSIDDGIVGKDYLVINNATINITTDGDGLKASNDLDISKGNILIENGEFYIYTAKDSIIATNIIQINDGDFTLESGGGFEFILKDITVGEGTNGYIQTNAPTISSKSLKANNILINNGNFNISSYEDAIHSDGEIYIKNGIFNISSGDDGIHANDNLIIDNLDLKISNGYEGLEGASIIINGGNIDIQVYDDAINASSDTGVLIINGGTIYIYSNGDGIDSNGDLIINNCNLIIENQAIYTMGDSAIDVSGSITVNGGTIVDENGIEIDYNTVMHSAVGNINGPGMNRR